MVIVVNEVDVVEDNDDLDSVLVAGVFGKIIDVNVVDDVEDVVLVVGVVDEEHFHNIYNNFFPWGEEVIFSLKLTSEISRGWGGRGEKSDLDSYISYRFIRYIRIQIL